MGDDARKRDGMTRKYVHLFALTPIKIKILCIGLSPKQTHCLGSTISLSS